jgi:undecaprenyl-diphosphatase
MSPSAPGASAPRLSSTHALILGALQGPAELLPISSSGHVALLPWLLGWDHDRLEGELRKSFEVALHAGSAAALLITLRDEALPGPRARRLSLIGLSCAPPALIGYALERPIERRLGRPESVAAGLIAGSVAMVLADRAPQLRGPDEAGWRDALWLGVSQACALMPGVSRNGATLMAARWRRFTRQESNRLSRHVAVPVIAGATALKAMRLGRRGLPPGMAIPFAAGGAASFVSTLGSSWLIRSSARSSSLLPYAVYRTALGSLVLARLARRNRPRPGARGETLPRVGSDSPTVQGEGLPGPQRGAA